MKRSAHRVRSRGPHRARMMRVGGRPGRRRGRSSGGRRGWACQRSRGPGETSQAGATGGSSLLSASARRGRARSASGVGVVSTQHRNLVTEHEDLDIFGCVGSGREAPASSARGRAADRRVGRPQQAIMLRGAADHDREVGLVCEGAVRNATTRCPAPTGWFCGVRRPRGVGRAVRCLWTTMRGSCVSQLSSRARSRRAGERDTRELPGCRSPLTGPAPTSGMHRATSARPTGSPARSRSRRSPAQLAPPSERSTCWTPRPGPWPSAGTTAQDHVQGYGRVSLCPWQIGAITAAALVLLHTEHDPTTSPATTRLTEFDDILGVRSMSRAALRPACRAPSGCHWCAFARPCRRYLQPSLSGAHHHFNSLSLIDTVHALMVCPPRRRSTSVPGQGDRCYSGRSG